MNSNTALIREKGLNVLTKELGLIDTIQFLRLFETGTGNYTEERKTLLKDFSVNDIAQNIREKKRII
ncbi:MAG: hypothetical protein FWH22_01455 [Fibromonadales bacterium]|nr:hypothetical protein [Fibromonadales bacterium]